MTVRRVDRADDSVVQIVERIYESSIPANERKPTSWIGEVAARPEFVLLVAEANGVAVGFATMFVPAGSAALLEYLAVDAGSRDAGIGSTLFASAVALAVITLIEVEAGVDDVTRRRIAFYLRRGCQFIEGLRYQLPLDTNPPPMQLMVFPAATQVTPASMRRSLSAIYERVYQQSSVDCRISEMLSQLSFGRE